MANTQAMCNSFKTELLNGVHQFGSPTIVSRTSLTSPTADTFKGALYLASGSLSKSTTAYSATSEVGNSGSYSAGGATLTMVAPALSTDTATTQPNASISFTSFTATAFDTLLIYNSTQSNKAVSVHTFGSQTITAGTFTLTMPTNDASNALIRLA